MKYISRYDDINASTPLIFDPPSFISQVYNLYLNYYTDQLVAGSTVQQSVSFSRPIFYSATYTPVVRPTSRVPSGLYKSRGKWETYLAQRPR